MSAYATARFDPGPHDARDPSPWLALFLDQTTPLDEEVKAAWLACASSRSRQFLLPVTRPFARAMIILLQMIKTVVPDALTSSWLLHRALYWGLRTFVSPEANLLILRHFHIGSETLAFIARNVPGVEVPARPLRPRSLEDVKDDLFLNHDLNLFNFIIEFNRQLKEKKLEIGLRPEPDFSCITDGPYPIEPLPAKWTNFLDLESAIEIFTPIYQLLLTDNDFWRAANSLQLDETIGIYVARILGTPEHMVLVNNKHPLVADSTLRAGNRLVLHGLSSEALHALLVQMKRKAAAR